MGSNVRIRSRKIADLDRRVRVKSGIQAAPTDTGLVILDANSGSCWELNESGALVWPLLETGASPREAGMYLVSRMEVEEFIAQADLLKLINTLVQAGILVAE